MQSQTKQTAEATRTIGIVLLLWGTWPLAFFAGMYAFGLRLPENAAVLALAEFAVALGGSLLVRRSEPHPSWIRIVAVSTAAATIWFAIGVVFAWLRAV